VTITAAISTPRSANCHNVGTLISSIKAQLHLLDRTENTSLTAVLTLAANLAALRQHVKRHWAKYLQKLNICPRVGSRYLAIAKSALAEIGLDESQVARVPADLVKLEWISKLDCDQVVHLLEELDCRRSSRGEVIAAVKKHLGQTASETEPDVEKELGRLIERLVGLAGRIQSKPPAVASRATDSLLAGLQRVREAIAAGVDAAGVVALVVAT
jgi:hypothetical protein